jgi:hypothetical protein
MWAQVLRVILLQSQAASLAKLEVTPRSAGP